MSQSFFGFHASGDTFMKIANTVGDVELIIDPKDETEQPLFVTLTEMLDPKRIAAVERSIEEQSLPYRLVNPDRGDIAFLVHKRARPMSWGGALSVAANPAPARLGGHGPRLTSWCEIAFAGETIFLNGNHFVTFFVDSENHRPGAPTRGQLQVKQAHDVGALMQKQAVGRNLAIGSGDLNGELPNRADLQAVFDSYGMTTTAEETGVMTGTHGAARIDYVWTMDKDHRLSVVDMKVLKSSKFKSDHDPIRVEFLIKS